MSVDKRKAGDSTYLRSESTCTANQNYTATQKDARAKVVQLATDLNAGTLTTVTDPNNQSVSYGYDALRRVASVQSTASGNTYKNEYAYDAADRLRRVQHNTTDNSICDVQYTFSYDEAGRPTTVQVGAQTLSSNTYNPDGTLNTCTYGNGAVTQTVYDGFKRVTGVLYNGSRQFTTEYAANGDEDERRLWRMKRIGVPVRQGTMRAIASSATMPNCGCPARLIDHALNRVSASEYDLANRPMRVITTNGAGHLYTGEVEYDGQNNLKTFKEKVGVTRTAYQTDFAYDVENKPTLVSQFGMVVSLR